MRKTKFTEWLEELGGLQKKLTDVHALSDVKETITLDGKVITINLGKEYNAEVSDFAYPIQPRQLRSLYTNNKDDFDALLESLKQGTEAVVEATDTILSAISEEAVPGAVIARMKGEQVSGDSPDLVKEMAGKKLKELQILIKKQLPVPFLPDFTMSMPIAGHYLEMECSEEDCDLSYDALHARRHGVTVGDVEVAMYFLANFEVIKAKLQSLLDQLKAIKV